MKPKDVLKLYASLWKEKYGKTYTISWQKNMAQAKRLLANHEADDLVGYIQHYFGDFVHRFASNSFHSFGGFVYLINEVVASYAEEQKKRGVENADYAKRVAARAAQHLGASTEEQASTRDLFANGPNSGGAGSK